jgi:hypothetical protein
MNRTSNFRKQNSSGHFSPKSPDCLPDGSGSHIRIEQKLVRSVTRSLTTECTLTDQETFKEALAHSGCNAMEEEEKCHIFPSRTLTYIILGLKSKCCFCSTSSRIYRVVTTHCTIVKSTASGCPVV